ncbi:RHS repeat-associated core domain-containing protein [Bosea sp. (in: a-proteobacteria)]|uniref:RHS repeat-associated core domain-containing protein n=1 Tax=Bosea sp. (in: a-proteobacteria) TaxID=1871050 RepID=UPI0031FEC866
MTGPAALDARFPGQWFQLETGLHYNWHRHYDPTPGRYLELEPLGFVDGTSVYTYGDGVPTTWTDELGLNPGLRIFLTYIRSSRNIGAKSGPEFLKHARQNRDGLRRIDDLIDQCKRARSHGERQSLRAQYDKEVRELERHFKEMRQKWPDSPIDVPRVPKWPG